ncbi:hypothetical protein KHA93_00180 [Bacillus sp. FJAT-49732]|uniref:Multi-TM2 domain-containing protein n=1 Tax=Lederbergia citrisecunda TaxID=2833583 RepID=A0A942TJU3_9BACI|nr:hypothetical protein [Lederbergia citrisecunda]MBS4198076.1 hypothetical protein [Lederbergia citrisecunda]
MNKNPFIAFLLAFFPGGGLMYLGKVLRGLFYTATVFGIPLVSFGLAAMSNEGIFAAFAIGGVIMYIINFIDTVVTASKLYQQPANTQDVDLQKKANDSERFFTIVLSIVPGLGHFQLGLVYRGMTLLASFLGAMIMVLFVTMMTGRSEFLVFLATLPIIWIYGFFDVIRLLDAKQKGETLVDKSVLEDIENRSGEGRKSKAIATLLSIIPGAGHLYLGLQKRGIQLMAAFLFSIYILDVLRLGIFLFVVPIIWFFSFFDGLQKASRAESDEVEDDVPIVSFFVNHQKWVGIGLIALGVYYLGTNILMPIVAPYFQRLLDLDINYWFYRYFQTGVLCILLIGGGIKLMSGKKITQAKEEGDTE